MDATAPLCEPGCLYVRGNARAIAITVEFGRVLIAPVLVRNLPAMRGDVVVTDLADLGAMGLPGGAWIIRTAGASECERFRAMPLGRAPDPMLRAVQAAFRQASAAAALEAKYRAASDPPRLPTTRGWKRAGH